MAITVVHNKKDPYDIYIGRKNGSLPESKWHNPFPVVKGKRTRKQAIAEYETYVLSSQDLMNSLWELDDKVLGCWCSPKDCHGHVLVRLRKAQKKLLKRKTVATAYCDGGAKPNPGAAGWGTHINIDGKEINRYCGLEGKNTNNLAELVAATKVLEYLIMEADCDEVVIYADSKYVLDNLSHVPKWARNKWCTGSGSPVKNREAWVALDRTIKEFDRPIKWKHVKAHNGNYGNDCADRNATLGREAAAVGDYEEITTEGVVKVPQSTKKSNKKKATVLPMHPQLNGKRWFFLTNPPETPEEHGQFYCATTFEDKVETRNKLAGKRTSDTHFSLLHTTKKIKQLEALKDTFNTLSSGHLPVIADLAEISKRATWENLQDDPNDYYEAHGTNVTDPEGIYLAGVVRHPLLVFELDTVFESMITLLDSIRTEDNKVFLTDITDYVYSKDKKDKQIMSPSFDTTDREMVVENHEYTKGCLTDVKLTVGLDLPLRLMFSRLLKFKPEEDIKVELVTIAEQHKVIRIFTIVHDNGDTSVHCSPDSNFRYLNKTKGK